MWNHGEITEPTERCFLKPWSISSGITAKQAELEDPGLTPTNQHEYSFILRNG